MTQPPMDAAPSAEDASSRKRCSSDDVMLMQIGGGSEQQRPDCSLLIVEDDAFQRAALRMMLETITRGDSRSPAGKSPEARQPAISLHVESAEDGENGWEKLRSGHFDLALVDIHLPGASGVDLAWCYQQIHAESLSRSAQEPHTSCSKQTIIIACTADTNVDRDQLERCGMHDMLTKPIDLRALRHVLHKWMPRDSSPPSLLPQPAGLQRNTSGIFAGRVILVDDCEVTLSMSELLLQQQGLCIDTASSGEQAMDMLAKRDYDLLLIDVHLPGLSGYALCSWYKDMCKGEGRAIGYVVAVTSDPDDATCREFGIDQCLSKPLSTACITGLLKAHWAKRSGASPAHTAVGWAQR